MPFICSENLLHSSKCKMAENRGRSTEDDVAGADIIRRDAGIISSTVDRDDDCAADNLPDSFIRSAPEFECEGSPASIGTLSILPASFGSIYASETFRAFVSTYNISQSTVRAVSVSLDMQSSSQRRVSLVISKSAADLQPRKAISNIVSIPLPELGVHVLICTAVYRDKSNSQRTLRQLFRFNVFPPLETFVNVVPIQPELPQFSRSIASVTTIVLKPHATSLQTEQRVQFLVELRVLNTMPVSVYITSVELVTQPEYDVTSSLIRADHPVARAESKVGLSPSELPFLDRNQTATDVSASNNATTDYVPQGETWKNSNTFPPARGASAGTGDTNSFLFFVSRPSGESGISQDASLPSEAGGPLQGDKESEALSMKRYDKPQLRTASAGQKFARHKSLPTGATTPSTSSHTTSKLSFQHKASLDSATEDESRSRLFVSRKNISATQRKIGAFSIRWRSGSGECGKMDSFAFVFEPIVKAQPIEIQITAVPDQIRAHAPFAAKCVVRNNTETSLRLYLQVRRDLVGDVVPVGISGISLGEVDPESAVECLVTFIALRRGQHSISGVRVVEVSSRQSFNAEPPIITVL